MKNEPYTVIFSNQKRQQPPINIHVMSNNHDNAMGEGWEQLTKRVTDSDINVNTDYGILRVECGHT